MRRRAGFVAVALGLVAAVPGAAHAQDAEVQCYVRTDHRAEHVATTAETLYVRMFSGMSNGVPALIVQLWRESNDVAGLQVSDTECSDGSVIPADWKQLDVAVPDPTRLNTLAV